MCFCSFEKLCGWGSVNKSFYESGKNTSPVSFYTSNKTKRETFRFYVFNRLNKASVWFGESMLDLFAQTASSSLQNLQMQITQKIKVWGFLANQIIFLGCLLNALSSSVCRCGSLALISFDLRVKWSNICNIKALKVHIDLSSDDGWKLLAAKHFNKHTNSWDSPQAASQISHNASLQHPSQHKPSLIILGI